MNVTDRPYASQSSTQPTSANQESCTIQNILKNRVLFFNGYTGSGKGTQGKKLSDHFNIRHLSTGELFRAEANKKTDIGLKMDSYMQKGQVIPKELTFEYLKQELSKPEYRNGFILDGYPKNIESFEFLMQTLKELQLEPLAAMHFAISREEVLQRLTGRRHCNGCEHDFHILFLPPKQENTCDQCTSPLVQRPDDSESAIQKRLDVFEDNTSPVIERFSTKKLLVRMKAEIKPDEVYKDILETITEIGRKQIEESSSYYLRIPKGQENTATFHNHIDASSHTILRTIIHEIEKVNLTFQNKIYPVSHLHLGPQTKDAEFSSVYQNLPNFHSIKEAKNEAFATGKMGEEGFNYDQIKETLQVVFQHPNEGLMTELEEDIYQKDFDPRGNSTIMLDKGETPYAIDWSKLPEWKEKQIPGVPRFELHHGFDFIKRIGETQPPIDPSDLSEKTTAMGFQTGGWFIFRKNGVWSYRSNQFSNQDYAHSIDILKRQAQQLRDLFAKILPSRDVNSSCSMEKVHAMWRVS
jgi:adenylate kinase